MNPTHRLNAKDTGQRTAVCSVCGPVKILPSGRGWVCAVKKRQRKAEWAALNPDRVAASRRQTSGHTLSDRGDIHPTSNYRMATCVQCGRVAAVPWGRGWICGMRAAELRKVQQEQPFRQCRDCGRWFQNLSEGLCVRCTVLSTPHRSLDPSMRDTAPMWDSTVELLARRDFHEPRDDYRDRTVPGLKVIGARDVPEQWRWALEPYPDWSRLDQM